VRTSTGFPPSVCENSIFDLGQVRQGGVGIGLELNEKINIAVRTRRGLDHKSVQNPAQRCEMVLKGDGRTPEISYPWKWKLTEGRERWPKALPRMTLAHVQSLRQGRRDDVRDELR
jgi:hypothetical protein